jgi:hypothetical protein
LINEELLQHKLSKQGIKVRKENEDQLESNEQFWKEPEELIQVKDLEEDLKPISIQ